MLSLPVGTPVTVVLPLPAAPIMPLRSLTILLAEDNMVNQVVASRLLEKQGHHVTVVSTGREAVDWLATHACDVVLMDVQMPDMNGFEATAAIRAREHGTPHHQPILAMTAYARAEDRDRCLGAGMNAYVSKPISATRLQASLAELCAAHPAADGGSARTA